LRPRECCPSAFGPILLPTTNYPSSPGFCTPFPLIPNFVPHLLDCPPFQGADSADAVTLVQLFSSPLLAHKFCCFFTPVWKAARVPVGWLPKAFLHDCSRTLLSRTLGVSGPIGTTDFLVCRCPPPSTAFEPDLSAPPFPISTFSFGPPFPF